ncbi:MAG: sulfurtransferase [Bacteroidetes bacterium]|nr:sulfurtransferase [Bacteroidota bacterium]
MGEPTDPQFNSIPSKELLARASRGAKIIDVRSADAYNGWRLKGEVRGGHIRGARSLPVKWTQYMDWIEVVRHKHIFKEDELIVYGYNAEESRTVASLFHQAGYDNVSVYDHFLSEWVSNHAYPMDKLPRYRHLVPADWVRRLIAGEHPAEYDNDRFVVVHSHYRNRDAYLKGHIPGAIDMDTLALESPETWNRRSPEELRKALEEHGITADTTVVLYGTFMHPDNDEEFPGSAAGQLGAIRNAFIMMYAGVKDVRVLNGGFQSWKDANFDISTEDVPKSPVSDFGVTIPSRPELAVDTPEARRMIASRDADLVCVRSYPEYVGEVSGYNYIEAKGRIPGVVFANCGSDAYHMENYRNVDHTTREFHEIDEIWKSSGITSEKHLAFYCGTGWRGSEAWLNAWLMGWPRVSVYDGGWFEWSNDPVNPRAAGVTKISDMHKNRSE